MVNLELTCPVRVVASIPWNQISVSTLTMASSSTLAAIVVLRFRIGVVFFTAVTSAVQLDPGMVDSESQSRKLKLGKVYILIFVHVKHPVACHTGEMMVGSGVGVEMAVIMSEFTLDYQPQLRQSLQITVNCSNSYVRNALPDHFVNLIRPGVAGHF